MKIRRAVSTAREARKDSLFDGAVHVGDDALRSAGEEW